MHCGFGTDLRWIWCGFTVDLLWSYSGFTPDLLGPPSHVLKTPQSGSEAPQSCSEVRQSRPYSYWQNLDSILSCSMYMRSATVGKYVVSPPGMWGPAQAWKAIGIVLESFWDHLGMVWESFRDRFGIVLGSFWDRFGIIWRWFGDPFRLGLGSFPMHLLWIYCGCTADLLWI